MERIVNPLIVALDADVEKAQDLVRRLKAQVFAFKIGSFLFSQEGPSIVRRICEQGCRVFLDLKWHDIPHTVSGAVRAAVRLGAWGTTLHCLGGYSMLKEAAQACGEESQKLGVTPPLLFGVTVLTSLREGDLYRLGINRTVESQVKRLAVLAMDAGLDGVVCSGKEIGTVRKACGRELLAAVPGIQWGSSLGQDQKRSVRLGRAVEEGADFLILGRAVLEAEDPQSMVAKILDDIQRENTAHVATH